MKSLMQIGELLLINELGKGYSVNEEKNIKKSITFEKIVFIIRYIFLGLICWSFYYSIISIIRKSTVGIIIGLISIVIFGWMSSDIISPKKLNNKEFGKYTNILAFLIELITTLCLFLLFGIGF
jgi:hypothetical protein